LVRGKWRQVAKFARIDYRLDLRHDAAPRREASSRPLSPCVTRRRCRRFAHRMRP